MVSSTTCPGFYISGSGGCLGFGRSGSRASRLRSRLSDKEMGEAGKCFRVQDLGFRVHALGFRVYVYIYIYRWCLELIGLIYRV